MTTTIKEYQYLDSRNQVDIEIITDQDLLPKDYEEMIKAIGVIKTVLKPTLDKIKKDKDEDD